MGDRRIDQSLPRPLRAYIGLVAVAGMALLVVLVLRAQWDSSAVGEMCLFIVLVVVAGSFPLPVSPRVKADVTTAVLFAAALLLEPGAAALAGVTGITTYTVLNRYWGERLVLPWYKHPFNAGETALYVGAASLVFHAIAPDDQIVTPAVALAAAVVYMANTALVSVVASIQLKSNPIRVWMAGSLENGPSELAQLAFGFLGAMAYHESPWTVVALFIPVAILYIAFSRLARSNARLEDALKKLEAVQGRIVSTSKLASIGAISLDLAHQIKNPLAVLLGRLEDVQERLEEGSRSRRHVDIAMDAGWRIHELTQTFSSIGEQKWIYLDMGELLDEAFGMAGLRNRKQIETHRDYTLRTVFVKGNPVLLREALSNIFSNAMEAVEEEGRVTVSVSNEGDSVVTHISDNGAGISADQIVHVFEPFFTTKPDGHGLGLFAARHIMEMHNGSIKVSSTPGQRDLRYPGSAGGPESRGTAGRE